MNADVHDIHHDGAKADHILEDLSLARNMMKPLMRLWYRLALQPAFCPAARRQGEYLSGKGIFNYH